MLLVQRPSGLLLRPFQRLVERLPPLAEVEQLPIRIGVVRHPILVGDVLLLQPLLVPFVVD